MSDTGDDRQDSRGPGAVHQEGDTGREAGGVRHGILFKGDGREAGDPAGGDQG